MCHCFLEEQTDEVKRLAAERGFNSPVFVGQGCTYSVGSDSYGYYVVDIPRPGRLAAVTDADCEWATDWCAGDMTSSFPAVNVLKWRLAGSRPEDARLYGIEYVMKYGRRWYWCDVEGGKITRRLGDHAGLSWNGAFSHRDPSF